MISFTHLIRKKSSGPRSQCRGGHTFGLPQLIVCPESDCSANYALGVSSGKKRRCAGACPRERSMKKRPALSGKSVYSIPTKWFSVTCGPTRRSSTIPTRTFTVYIYETKRVQLGEDRRVFIYIYCGDSIPHSCTYVTSSVHNIWHRKSGSSTVSCRNTLQKWRRWVIVKNYKFSHFIIFRIFTFSDNF
jgi:hypothetical protein